MLFRSKPFRFMYPIVMCQETFSLLILTVGVQGSILGRSYSPTRVACKMSSLVIIQSEVSIAF